MRPDDAELVRAVLAGRTERFAELVNRHAAAVFRIVRSAVRQEADAEDVAQEVFLASFRNLPRLRDPARFRAHLLVIAARRATDYLRRKRRGVPVSLEDEPAAPPRDEQADSRLAAVAVVLDRLEPEAQLVFALRHHEGLSCKQIATMLDVADGTIYSRLSRIHAAIRRVAEVSE